MNWPNRLSILRVLMIPFIVLTLYLPGAGAAALALFVLACVTDWLDGWMARRYHIVTNFGKFLDPVADKLLVLSTVIALCGRGDFPAWACVIFLMRELAVDGLRLVAVEQGRVIAAGKLGKIKTTLQMLMVISLLLAGCGLELGVVPWVLTALALLMTVYRGVDYFARNRAVLGGAK